MHSVFDSQSGETRILGRRHKSINRSSTWMNSGQQPQSVPNRFVFYSFRYEDGGGGGIGQEQLRQQQQHGATAAAADGTISVLGSPIRFEPPELNFQEQWVSRKQRISWVSRKQRISNCGTWLKKRKKNSFCFAHSKVIAAFLCPITKNSFCSRYQSRRPCLPKPFFVLDLSIWRLETFYFTNYFFFNSFPGPLVCPCCARCAFTTWTGRAVFRCCPYRETPFIFIVLFLPTR